MVLDVLEASATRRDAKVYLSRFKRERRSRGLQASKSLENTGLGANLGRLYLPSSYGKSLSASVEGDRGSKLASLTTGPLHIALVKIQAPEIIEQETLRGILRTLAQLSRLGMNCVILPDCDARQESSVRNAKLTVLEQTDRIVDAIDAIWGHNARRVDGIISIDPVPKQQSRSPSSPGKLHVSRRENLISPLRRGMIPVIPPIGYDAQSQSQSLVAADEVLLALVRECAGLPTWTAPEADPNSTAQDIEIMQKQISLDRVIILDSLGGIPAANRLHGSQVFINLEDEFNDIRHQLLKMDNNAEQHVRNLVLLKSALEVLPPSSSGLLATPEQVASSSTTQSDHGQEPGVRTRKQRNPLIHNLLTDKPAFSSSLPLARIPSTTPQASATNMISARSMNSDGMVSGADVHRSAPSLVKRGMTLSIIPNPKTVPWSEPTACHPTISLSDPRIDLPRLVHLIEDSFHRKLDLQHYLRRIENRVAGIIIAGSYEGGAILTWEHFAPTNTWVPYLDKFAVLKRSQGAGSVADIVYNAMVRDCFPNGVCWRSRRDNPVNKWYFERAKGMWQLPGTMWTMFWTTEGIESDGRLEAYEKVCRGVEPSWADDTGVVD